MTLADRRGVRGQSSPHVGQDHDAVVGALRALEDRVEVRAAMHGTSVDLAREAELRVGAVERDELRVVREDHDRGASIHLR
jgi:hypothetical protein